MEGVAENIYPLLDRAVELAAAGFARDVRLFRQYDPSLPFAEINGDAFVQVMLNLLKNAAEALEGMEQGEICIATAYRHGVSVMIEGRGNASLPIEIQISDNGPGVPDRSEEHTSELQSLMRISYSVFCLKKTNKTNTAANDSSHPHV